MRQRGWALLAGAAGLAILLGFASAGGAQTATPPTPAAPPASPGYVGMDTCAACHEEVVNAFKATPHISSEKGCEGCHGPGQEHAENAGDKTKIRIFKGLSSTESSAVCMDCHNKGNQKHWMGSSHDSRKIACTECHNPHPKGAVEKALLKAPQMKLCTSCHLQKKAQLIRPGHMPLREGRLPCQVTLGGHHRFDRELVEQLRKSLYRAGNASA
jgi:DmsE family decaheme c-type cytochrome